MSYARAAGILGITLLMVVGCSWGSPKDVTVATASPGAIVTEASGLGTASAAVDVSLAVAFRDQVLGVSVGVGQHVTRGQDLLSLDPQPLVQNAARLRASMQGIQADLGHVIASLAADQWRAPALVPGLQARQQALLSRADITNQLLSMAQNRQSSVTSPIDGDVLAVNVRAGQIAAPGVTLVEIVDSSRLTVSAELPVSAQSEIMPGAPAQITFTNVPGLTITGTVSGVSSAAVNNGTGFQVVLDAANTADRRVHHGYRALTHVPYAHRANPVVRRMAVLDIEHDPSIFVVQGGTVRRRQVQLGIRDGSNVEITSGVAPGDVYVLVGTQSLDTGDRVRIAAARGPIAGPAS
ncbi:MAG TPA: efflux RND transporter periplasmic adaptor subunit [Candidatus Dormibacteraeota bacterium]